MAKILTFASIILTSVALCGCATPVHVPTDARLLWTGKTNADGSLVIPLHFADASSATGYFVDDGDGKVVAVRTISAAFPWSNVGDVLVPNHGYRLYIAEQRKAPAATQPTTNPAAPVPSVTIKVLSTPEEVTRGQFHWIVTPSTPAALCLRCDLLEGNGKTIFAGGGQVIPITDGLPIEVIGGLKVEGCKITLHLRGYHSPPRDVPALFDTTDSEYFGSESSDSFSSVVQSPTVDHLSSDYAPIAWTQRLRAGRPSGTVFCIARLVPPDASANEVPPTAIYRVPAPLP